tara:strand:- start:97 stop:618 length:522 start_codon:yes stop_codon:yes gene_type:complete
MLHTIIITNSHPHGFCFACDTISNEQVFVPIHVAEGYTLQPGDKIKALLVPNFADKSARGTPWQAVRLYSGKDVPIDQVSDGLISANEIADATLAGLRVNDNKILEFIRGGGYYSSQEVAAYFDTDKEHLFEPFLNRLFEHGKIVKAAVMSQGDHNPLLTLWAESADKFIEVV